MNSLIAENLLKKSTSLANLGPFSIIPGQLKMINHHKSII